MPSPPPRRKAHIETPRTASFGDGSRPSPSRSWRDAVRLTVVAVRFLTRIPVPAVGESEGDLARARFAYPAVGLLVGGVGVGVAALAATVLPPLPVAILAVTAMVATTGAFHEDGLADTFDGLWGGWDVDRRLAIMKDSRIGTYGTVALVASLGLRVSLLVGLSTADVARAVLVGHVVGRSAILVATASRWRPAVPVGTGGAVHGPLSPAAWLAAIVTVGATVGLAVGVHAWAPLVAGAAGGGAMAWYAHRRIGGYVGDVLGAIATCTHLAAMVAVVAVVTR